MPDNPNDPRVTVEENGPNQRIVTCVSGEGPEVTRNYMPVFLEIAEKALKAAEVADKEGGWSLESGRPPPGEQESRRMVQSSVEAREQRVVAIVFSAFAAEAAINWFAHGEFSAGTWDKIEQLSAVSKCMLIVNWVRGQKLSPGEPPLQGLGELMRWRNELAHNKSKDMTASELFKSDYTNEEARRAFTSAKELLEFLNTRSEPSAWAR